MILSRFFPETLHLKEKGDLFSHLWHQNNQDQADFGEGGEINERKFVHCLYCCSMQSRKFSTHSRDVSSLKNYDGITVPHVNQLDSSHNHPHTYTPTWPVWSTPTSPMSARTDGWTEWLNLRGKTSPSSWAPQKYKYQPLTAGDLAKPSRITLVLPDVYLFYLTLFSPPLLPVWTVY